MRAPRVSSTYQVGQALLRNWRWKGCRFPGEKQLFDYETRIRLQRNSVNQVLSSLAVRRCSKHRQSNSGSRVSLNGLLGEESATFPKEVREWEISRDSCRDL
jgi:hypothetical protein